MVFANATRAYGSDLSQLSMLLRPTSVRRLPSLDTQGEVPQPCGGVLTWLAARHGGVHMISRGKGRGANEAPGLAFSDLG